MGSRNNFGQVNDVRAVVEIPCGASVAFKYRGGKFVTQDQTTRRLTLAIAADVRIIGWAEVGEFTASSTAGQDKVAVNIAKDAIYEMPIDAAQTEAELKALVGKSCDIILTSTIQYADYDAGSDNVLQIVGYHYYGPAAGEQTVLVRINAGGITVDSVT